MLPVALVAAVILGDKVALRATPDRTAAQQAVLWKGDWLEVRGARRGWLKVYDHRHERPGWVAEANARVVELDEQQAPALRAVVDFLSDAPGSESLGIAYAALYMKVAPKGGIDAPLLVEVGAMAERLAVRASRSTEATATEQLAVAQSWGIAFASVERAPGSVGGASNGGVSNGGVSGGGASGGGVSGGGGAGGAGRAGPISAGAPFEEAPRICFDGAAYRQALALGPAPADEATAVLGLTVPACAPSGLGATELQARDEAALALLERVDPTRVAGPVGDRLRVRRAVIGAHLAWATARKGDAARAAKLADAAVSAYARVDKSELADDDVADYESAALEIAATRWAALPAAVPGPRDPHLALDAGEPGQTCISIATGTAPIAKAATGTVKTATAAPSSGRKCTYGQVWPASFRIAPGGGAAALAVQPLPGWLELWLFRRGADGGWMVDVLTPSTDGPDLGYAELAGWSPDGSHAVIVREARTAGATHRTFSAVALGSLAPDKESSTLAGLGAAKRWVAPEWRGRTLALR